MSTKERVEAVMSPECLKHLQIVVEGCTFSIWRSRRWLGCQRAHERFTVLQNGVPVTTEEITTLTWQCYRDAALLWRQVDGVYAEGPKPIRRWSD